MGNADKLENTWYQKQHQLRDPPFLRKWNAESARKLQDIVTGRWLDRPNTDKYTERGRGHGLGYAVSSMRGWRADMNDCHSVDVYLDKGLWRNASLLEWSYFAVFHGHAGDSVSSYCADQLLGAIIYNPEFQEDIVKGIKSGFVRLDNRIRRLPDAGTGKDKASSSALCVLISPFNIYLANCGDSRAVLYGKGEIFETNDHNPMNCDERKRVETAGGQITLIHRLSGLLTTTRSLGGFRYKNNLKVDQNKQIIISEPEVNVVARSPKDEFLVLASKGVWDVMNSQQVSVFVKQQLQITDDLELITHSLLNTCLYKGSKDNITAIIIKFPFSVEPIEKMIIYDKQTDLLIESRIREIMIRDKYIDMDQLLNKLMDLKLPYLFPAAGLYAKYSLIENLYNELKGPHQSEAVLSCDNDQSHDLELAILY